MSAGSLNKEMKKNDFAIRYSCAILNLGIAISIEKNKAVVAENFDFDYQTKIISLAFLEFLDYQAMLLGKKQNLFNVKSSQKVWNFLLGPQWKKSSL